MRERKSEHMLLDYVCVCVCVCVLCSYWIFHGDRDVPCNLRCGCHEGVERPGKGKEKKQGESRKLPVLPYLLLIAAFLIARRLRDAFLASSEGPGG